MSKKGTLMFKPLSADLIRDPDTFTKMDPYIVLKLDQDHKHRSTVCSGGGKKPTWQDNIPIDIYHQDIFSLEVWNQNSAGTDDLIGTVSVPLDSIQKAGTLTQEYTLVYDGITSGKVRIEFQWFGNQQNQQNQQPQQHQQPQQPQTIIIQQPAPYPQQTYPPQGYPQQPYPPQGYPQQSYPPQGYPQQSYPPQGYPQDYSQYPPQQGYPGQQYPPQYGQPGYPNQQYPYPGQQPPYAQYPPPGY